LSGWSFQGVCTHHHHHHHRRHELLGPIKLYSLNCPYLYLLRIWLRFVTFLTGNDLMSNFLITTRFAVVIEALMKIWVIWDVLPSCLLFTSHHGIISQKVWQLKILTIPHWGYLCVLSV
jgi:hypothetical protein